MGNRRIEVGRVIGPHGIRGLVKLHVFLEEPDRIATLTGLEDEAGRAVTLSLEGMSGRAHLVRIAGIETREAAEALGKATLFLPRAALPEPEADAFYAADLEGLAVLDEAGTLLGHVAGVAEFGAGPLIEVTPAEGGATVFLPFTAAVVPEVDFEAGQLRVALSPGLWPEKE